MNPQGSLRVVIACGGTGGHLFPGQAVAEELLRRGNEVALVVSPKEIDRQAIQDWSALRASPGLCEVVVLPAVGLAPGRWLAFLLAFQRSYRQAAKWFRARPPQAVLAMGGFTSAAPALAGRRLGAAVFLHESNVIPGRANRWLSRAAAVAFTGFEETIPRLRAREVRQTGTPVRAQFHPRAAAECRARLGLEPAAEVLLVMGGSQGAGGINDAVLGALPLLRANFPETQFLHLSGADDRDRVTTAYQRAGARAVVQPFLSGMEFALGAATVAVSRAGASSLAELAALRVPALLVPYPAATDNHQHHNAMAFARAGAARVLPQSAATPEKFVAELAGLLGSADARERMRAALEPWHFADAAERIALHLIERSSAARAAGIRRHRSAAQFA